MRERKRARLKGYDYSQNGAYFITACTYNRKELFGKIIDNCMQYNEWGEIAHRCWKNLVRHYANCQLDEHIVMPNHLHGIIVIENRSHGLPEIIRGFKTFSSRRINEMRKTPGVPVWQKSYYDRIIRNDQEMQCIREYIYNNPIGWQKDKENLNNK